jgi:hypothetical protein
LTLVPGLRSVSAHRSLSLTRASRP